MWSFHSFNCIFVCSDIGQRWVVSFFPAIFSHSAIPSNDYIQLKSVHGKRALALHSSLLFNRSVIIIFFFWNCDMWVSSAHCSELQVLNAVNGQFQVVQMWIFFNSLFSSIRTNCEWESMLYNSIRNVGENLQRSHEITGGRTWNMNPNWWFNKWYWKYIKQECWILYIFVKLRHVCAFCSIVTLKL